MSVNGLSLILVIALWGALSLLTIGLIIRLALAGMWRIYPLLLVYLTIDFIERYFFIRLGSRYYGALVAIQATEIVAAILVVQNLCLRSLAEHPALARFMKQSIFYLVGLCVLVGGTVLLANPAVPEGRNPFLHRTIALEEAAMSGLFVFVLALSSLLVWFPVRVRRNVASVYTGFAVSFGTQWATLHGANSMPTATAWMNIIGDLSSIIILVAWLVVIDLDGEQAVTVTGHRWNPSAFGQLTMQLSAINRSLEGTRNRSAI